MPPQSSQQSCAAFLCFYVERHSVVTLIGYLPVCFWVQSKLRDALGPGTDTFMLDIETLKNLATKPQEVSHTLSLSLSLYLSLCLSVSLSLSLSLCLSVSLSLCLSLSLSLSSTKPQDVSALPIHLAPLMG